MVLIVLGTGLLKPNVSSLVGDLYSEEDNRRDAGFSIFYMGINLGAFISPLIVGELMKYSFHLGFGIAAIGMFFGLLVFMLTKRSSLGLAGTYIANPLSPTEKKKFYTMSGLGAVLLAIVIAVTIQAGLLTFETFIAVVGILGFLIPTIYFIIMYRSPKTDATERSRILAFIPLFLASVMFWSIAEQGSTILATYADKRTQLDFAGIHISPAWFQSLNPLFIITLSTSICMDVGKTGKTPAFDPTKILFRIIIRWYIIRCYPLYRAIWAT